jgi:hypothetical protein
MQSKIPVQIKIIHERHAMFEMGSKPEVAALQRDICFCARLADIVRLSRHIKIVFGIITVGLSFASKGTRTRSASRQQAVGGRQ